MTNKIVFTVMNLLFFAGWITLAIVFHKWWLALFCVLTLLSYKKDDQKVMKKVKLFDQNKNEIDLITSMTIHNNKLYVATKDGLYEGDQKI